MPAGSFESCWNNLYSPMSTASERVLAELAVKGFLSLWSYPSPFNDKGVAQRGEGKEICDLLVIFGNDVIIFSDKSSSYPNSGNPETDWKRWWRSAIAESVVQILGAERWLKTFPDRVFADKKCSHRIDVPIPSKDAIRVHRVIVALGARERCRAFFNGGSGSLIIGGSAHSGDAPTLPFRIEGSSPGAPFVHVLDDVSLQVLMRERDTVGDFIEYLSKKEQAMSARQFLATGEEDLLAHFLMTLDINGDHSFLPHSDGNLPDMIFVDESNYATLANLPQFKHAKTVNAPSYGWDKLIEYFTHAWRQGLEVEVPPAHVEEALRVMALPRRSERRALAEMVRTLVAHEGPGTRTMAGMPVIDRNIGYAGVALPKPAGAPEEEYRSVRQSVMITYARSLKVRMPNLIKVLVLGFHAPHRGRVAEDMVLIDFNDWNDVVEAQTREDMTTFGWTAAGERRTELEFPMPELPMTRERARRLRQARSLAAKRRQP